ncbi:MAG: hypothetical protein ABI950_01695 [Solirubrobacteraceae bacterium]
MRRALLTVLACCLAAAGVVSATALAGKSSTSPPPTRADVRAKHESQRTAREDRIAQRLGKTGEQLRAARAAALADVLDQRVQAGRLSAAQRDAIVACRKAPLTCDRSNLPVRPRAALRGARTAFIASVASHLGVEVKALRAARRAERGGQRGQRRHRHHR